MEGAHVNEVVWFNARRVLPDNERNVLVMFVHVLGRSGFENRIAQAHLYRVAEGFIWKVDSQLFNPSMDCVTQWAEIDPKRGGVMPDPFPNQYKMIQYISNKK